MGPVLSGHGPIMIDMDCFFFCTGLINEYAGMGLPWTGRLDQSDLDDSSESVC